jgi:hypothetical protein
MVGFGKFKRKSQLMNPLRHASLPNYVSFYNSAVALTVAILVLLFVIHNTWLKQKSFLNYYLCFSNSIGQDC